MNDFVRQSLIKNTHTFCDKLTDAEMRDLAHYFVYEVNMEDIRPPSELQVTFINEFFGMKEWENHLHDLTKSSYFLLASYTFRTNFDFIIKVLLSDVFFRFSKLTYQKEDAKPKVVRHKPQISTADKKMLAEILREHEAMLEYHLEDEASLSKYSDDEVDLVKTKKEQLKFIQNFSL
jgi:hypothetical protein